MPSSIADRRLTAARYCRTQAPDGPCAVRPEPSTSAVSAAIEAGLSYFLLCELIAGR